MAIPEIEPAWYTFRAVFITNDDRTGVDLFDYHVKDNKDLKEILADIKRKLGIYQDAKEVKSISYKVTK